MKDTWKTTWLKFMTGCSTRVAIAYLEAENWDAQEARKSYKADHCNNT